MDVLCGKISCKHGSLMGACVLTSPKGPILNLTSQFFIFQKLQTRFTTCSTATPVGRSSRQLTTLWWIWGRPPSTAYFTTTTNATRALGSSPGDVRTSWDQGTIHLVFCFFFNLYFEMNFCRKGDHKNHKNWFVCSRIKITDWSRTFFFFLIRDKAFSVLRFVLFKKNVLFWLIPTLSTVIPRG